MFAISRSSPKRTKKEVDEYIKVSSLITEGSTLDRRKVREERRLTVERRKVFSSLFSGEEKRENKLEQRRKDLDRRNIDQLSSEVVACADKLKLNETSINALINEHSIIVKRLEALLSLKKEVGFNHIEDKVRDVYVDIQTLMQKEEYFLCFYLEINKEKLNEVHIEKLLSIINTDISKLSEEIVQLVEKYRLAKVNQTNIGFIQLDMGIIREKLSACLVKKKLNLYPIYIT